MKESYIKLPNITVGKLQDVVDFLDDNNIEYIEDYKRDKEIERLQNIIKELEKELEERYLDFKDSECEEVRTTAYEDISILQKIKELKGSDKE